MASDWKDSFSFAERYENIQTLQSSQGLSLDDAMSTEKQAYENAPSKEEYLTNFQPSTTPSHPVPSSPTFTPQEDPDSTLTIGPHKNCTYLTDGITSDVFRSSSSALKVITIGNQSMEPHNPAREVKILESLRGHEHIVQLLSTFRDQQGRLVLEFPYMPLTLADIFDKGERLEGVWLRDIFTGVLLALKDIHSKGMIHRDVKPSAILLSSPTGPACLSDFGTTWHPTFSLPSEPPSSKILDVGTGPYRAIDCLFGNKAYTSAIDIWALGVMLSEAITDPPTPVFESRPAHEDGSQLGLILSIFKTMGTPTREDWPEAEGFKVTPFEMWTVFPKREWAEILPGVDEEWRKLVGGCLRYQGRVTAEEALQYPCLQEP